MAASHSIFPVALILLCLSSSSFIPSLSALKRGFTIDLTHRDSPKSPFYNPHTDHRHYFTEAMLQSFARARLFSSSPSPSSSYASSTSSSSPEFSDSALSTVTNTDGEYLMTISIGTPPVALTATADTGSDLTWTRCFPCDDCLLQASDFLFNPEFSRSYQDLNCNTPTCRALPHSSCSVDDKCRYSYHYSDDSSSLGNLGLETITLDSSKGRLVIFENFLFGCGHDNELLKVQDLLVLDEDPILSCPSWVPFDADFPTV
ncbi:hypothetical protein Tsubulata_014007 [Turnera subulata]|uniref:Peptidase A1 domain-containing protein n=1 Tax=Turnera subulata TaxID=218843 RepID=A0A9Q0G1M4_9ROSI|nr:hypothetical protein Tsubulata_014007 [Turnera subulata]